MFRHFISLLPIISLASCQVLEATIPRLPVLKRQIGSSVNITELILHLMDAQTAIARFALLNNTGAGVGFNFLDNPPVGGGGEDGSIVLADDTDFPATVGNGMAMLLGFLGPCGMIPPHTHPRATEILINIAGPPVVYGVFNENGGGIVYGRQSVGTATMLPQNSMHFSQNDGCYPAVSVSVFNCESPGLMFASQAFAAFNEETMAAAFGAMGVPAVQPSSIPTVVVTGRQQCLARCGLPSDYRFSVTNNTEILYMAMAGYLKEQQYSPKKRSVIDV